MEEDEEVDGGGGGVGGGGGGGGGVNIISSDYCCDPDIYPWGYHQLTHCTAVNIA